MTGANDGIAGETPAATANIERLTSKSAWTSVGLTRLTALDGAEPWPRGPQDTREAHAAPFHTAESAQTAHRYDESHVPEPCATFLPACWPSPLPPYLRQRVRRYAAFVFAAT